MIKEHVGNLLAIDRGIIVHGCNARGRMGSGVALAIKHAFPLAYQAYQQQYRQSGLHLGDISVARVGDQKYVVNAVTQADYGRDPDRVYVDYEAVRQCFTKVNALAKELGLPVHFPLIGTMAWRMATGVSFPASLMKRWKPMSRAIFGSRLQVTRMRAQANSMARQAMRTLSDRQQRNVAVISVLIFAGALCFLPPAGILSAYVFGILAGAGAFAIWRTPGGHKNGMPDVSVRERAGG